MAFTNEPSYPHAMTDVLPFTPAEYDARLAACRREMQQRGLDVLVVNSPENIYYLSGFITKGYYVFQALVITHDTEPTLVVRRYELPNIERLSYYKRHAIWQDTDVPAEVLARLLMEIGAGSNTIGIDANSMFFKVADYEKLREALPHIRFVNASNVLEVSRAVKSPQEISYIRRAGQSLVKAFDAARAAAAPGRTENDVAAAFHEAAISSGSEYMAMSPYVTCGPRTALPHASWAGRVIEQDDLVLVEGSANWKRYSAPMMRSWCIGSPTDGMKRAYAASEAGLDAALSALKPGATSSDVDVACRGKIAQEGFGDAFIHRTGYSVGVGICPGWGEGWVMDLKEGDERELKPGMVFHIVPVLFPESEMSIGLSALAVVTNTGCEVLVEFPRGL